MNKETEKIIAEFDGFTDGVRMLMLIHRKKEGGAQRDRSAIKRIAYSQEEFEEELDKLVSIKNESDIPYRIYSSVNKRDMNKAIRIFKGRQLDADYEDEYNRDMFYLDIKNRWISAICNPKTKTEIAFMIDLDDKDGLKELKEKLFPIVGRNFNKFETKNGWHVVTPPFNPALLPGYDIKKDGLLLLSY